MGKGTGISWTDATFNAWWGCTKVSPGCDNCYAETLSNRWGRAHWGKGVPRRTFGDKHWHEPLEWNAEAGATGSIMRVFCGSMMDVMDDEAPEGQRERLWALINRTPNLMWQLLTKRPQRYTRYLPLGGFRHDNVILGATAENQELYNLRMPHLNRAADSRLRRIKTFISYEPALGPLSMEGPFGEPVLPPTWMIFGGETGANRRPCELEWAEAIKRECDRLGLAFFMKQMSARTPNEAANLIPVHMLSHQFPEEL